MVRAAIALPLTAALLLSACTSEPVRQAKLARLAAAERGRDFALGHCAGCHSIDVTGVSPYRAAPAFRDLRGWDGLALAVRLERSPVHKGADMPPRILTPREADDVTAFIAALRDGHPPDGVSLRPQLCNPMLFC